MCHPKIFTLCVHPLIGIPILQIHTPELCFPVFLIGQLGHGPGIIRSYFHLNRITRFIAQQHALGTYFFSIFFQGQPERGCNIAPSIASNQDNSSVIQAWVFSFHSGSPIYPHMQVREGSLVQFCYLTWKFGRHIYAVYHVPGPTQVQFQTYHIQFIMTTPENPADNGQSRFMVTW